MSRLAGGGLLTFGLVLLSAMNYRETRTRRLADEADKSRAAAVARRAHTKTLAAEIRSRPAFIALMELLRPDALGRPTRVPVGWDHGVQLYAPDVDGATNVEALHFIAKPPRGQAPRPPRPAWLQEEMDKWAAVAEEQRRAGPPAKAATGPGLTIGCATLHYSELLYRLCNCRCRVITNCLQ